jgi:hypothetical protein
LATSGDPPEVPATAVTRARPTGKVSHTCAKASKSGVQLKLENTVLLRSA